MVKNYVFPILILVFQHLAFSLSAQTPMGFEYNPEIPVKIGAVPMERPWDGGLNYVQFSDIDADYDGDMDLFVFDRSGDEISLFMTELVNGVPVYVYKHGGHHLFPADVRNRAVMVDYDNDGKKDLFTYAVGGLKVYKNVGNAGIGLQWQLASGLLMSEYPDNPTNLYVSSSDIPAIVDVEGDGDIDILTFHIGGERVEYHQNQSMELYGVPDSLEFIVKNECWGRFREDISTNLLALNNSEFPCGEGTVENPLRPESSDASAGPAKIFEPTRHAGSTMLALDMDNNGVLDLVLGDVAYTNLTLLTNGGTAPNTNSAMISQVTNFPQNTTPANMQLFPASFYVDVNHDGIKDLIVGANAKSISQNQKSVTYYENTGENNLPSFIFRSKAFLQGEMIDNGLGSIPLLFDQNGDGKKDLLISNFFRYKETLDKECSFLVYRNTGTAASPVFTYLDDNYLNFSGIVDDFRPVPTFGDLDNDGDQDMIVGLATGQLRTFTNTAGAGSPAAFGSPVVVNDNTGTAISAIDFAAPQLIDLDGDGLLDLAVGKKTGEIMYYRNSGTAASPQFTLVNPNLGGIDVATTTPDGYAIPHFFRQNDTLHLFVGAYDGRLHYFKGIEDHLEPDSVFQLVSHNFLGMDVGLYSSFWVEDIDGDGLLNLLVGQDLGGLHLLEVNPNSTIGLEELEEQKHEWMIVPNPANNQFELRSLNGNAEKQDVTVYSSLGQKIQSLEITQSTLIDISEFGKGVYLVVIISGDRKEVLRLVKD